MSAIAIRIIRLRFLCPRIPEGYQETERIVMAHWFRVTYTNEDGKIITWDQMMVQDQGELIVDIEYEQQIVWALMKCA